jgi:hypothetical protein
MRRKREGWAGRAAQGKEMGRNKRFEKSFYISRFRLKFEFEQVLHES